MKKKNILFGVLLAGAAISLAACTSNKSKDPTKTTGTDPVTTTPVTTTPASNKVTLTFNTMGGDAITSMKVEKGEDVGLPTPTRAKKVVDSTTHEAIAYEFMDWYLDAEYSQNIEENKFTEDTTLYARWREVRSAEDGYDLVQAQVNLSKYAITDQITSEFKRSIFSFGVGAQGRSRTNTWTCKQFDDFEDVNKFDSLVTGEKEYMFTHSFKVSGTTPLASFTARENGYVRLYVQNGSSSAKSAGVKVAIGGNSYNLMIPANYGELGNPVVQVCVEVEKDEDYVLSSYGGTTMDIYCIEAEYISAESNPDYISIDVNPRTNFLTGQDFEYNDLELDLNYENGKVEKIDINDDDLSVTPDNITGPGQYNVAVSYKDLDEISYKITVSDLNSFDIGIYEDELLMDTTSMDDPIYFNHSLKKIYNIGDSLDLNYLTINAFDTLNNKYLFKYFEDDYITYEVYKNSTKLGDETYEFNEAGKYTISVKFSIGGIEKTNEFYVDVVGSEIVSNTEAEETTYYSLVDAEYTGDIGAKVNVDGYYYNEFATIQQALEFYEAMDDIDDCKKEIYIMPGTYNEKLEITIPNLTLIGYYEDPSQVLIEWNSVYGVEDASGFVQERDSSQTVAVRESAHNVTFESITISNYYNSSARCAGLKDTRALALLVQSDKFIMKKCRLLGYQDTVNFFYGRQYIYDSYISGITDFIFGTNNTTLFQNCEIHTVGGKDNGYVTAFMGCSKGEEDRIDYGTIFSNCRFTADSDVGVGSISLGRCWGPYPAVAFLNCNMGAHISTAEADGSTAGKRYVSLAVSPLSEGTNFVEYANSGSGAVDHTIAGMTYLSKDEAANYLDVTIIFGTKNGNVEYPDVWDCFALFQ